jgi:hypothetical protein
VVEDGRKDDMVMSILTNAAWDSEEKKDPGTFHFGGCMIK